MRSDCDAPDCCGPTGSGNIGAAMRFRDFGPIAQLVELPAHNRLVPGSNPGGPTILRGWS
jgi:hypothetical protein